MFIEVWGRVTEIQRNRFEFSLIHVKGRSLVPVVETDAVRQKQRGVLRGTIGSDYTACWLRDALESSWYAATLGN